MDNRTKFLAVYKDALASALRSNPEDYVWHISELDAVFELMAAAIVKDTYNKDTAAIKKTCKALGIKHTYTAIKEYIAI